MNVKVAHENSNSIYYSDLLVSTRIYFDHAIRSLGFNSGQAFAYAYDEMSRFLEDKYTPIKIGAFVALFYYARKYMIEFKKDDQFCVDVLDELKSALTWEADDEKIYIIGGKDSEEFKAHVKLVREMYC